MARFTQFAVAAADEAVRDSGLALEEIDHAMLWYDLDGLLEKQDGEPPKLHIELDYTVEPFAKVEAEYIRIFEKYSRSEK